MVVKHYDMEDGTEIEIFHPEEFPWLFQVIHFQWPEMEYSEGPGPFPPPCIVTAMTLHLSKRVRTIEKALGVARELGVKP